jgi:hypothetical protein
MHIETCLKRNLGTRNLSLPEKFHSPKNVESQASNLQGPVLNGIFLKGITFRSLAFPLHASLKVQGNEIKCIIRIK